MLWRGRPTVRTREGRGSIYQWEVTSRGQLTQLSDGLKAAGRAEVMARGVIKKGKPKRCYRAHSTLEMFPENLSKKQKMGLGKRMSH